jgi:adenylosuccinate synthase
MHRSILVAGLGFGDEGKGSIVDYLARRTQARLVVRYNGGAQAGHHVQNRAGQGHTFSQFGSGSCVPGCRTLLSRHMLVNPWFLLNEASQLQSLIGCDPLGGLYVESEALVTTPYHVAANRLREAARGASRHGSCGMGIGETVDFALRHPADAVRVRDLYHDQLPSKLGRVRERLLADLMDNPAIRTLLYDADTDVGVSCRSALYANAWEDMRLSAFRSRTHLVGPEFLATELTFDGYSIFEGAQGVLLDQEHGFAPHHTWSDCTFHNADELLGDGPHYVVRLGLLRSYQTRHGAGPLPTEDHALLGLIRDDHNHSNPWQGDLRVGHLDLTLTRYACQVLGQLDGVVVSHLDQIDAGAVCASYYGPGTVPTEPRQFRQWFEQHGSQAQWKVECSATSRTPLANLLAERLGLPVLIQSFGPTAADKQSDWELNP